MKKRSIVKESFKTGFGLLLGYAAGKCVLAAINGAVAGCLEWSKKQTNATNESEETK